MREPILQSIKAQNMASDNPCIGKEQQKRGYPIDSPVF